MLTSKMIRGDPEDFSSRTGSKFPLKSKIYIDFLFFRIFEDTLCYNALKDKINTQIYK